MFNFDFAYDSINILLLIIMWYAGYNITYGRSYWGYASLAIISFSVVEGVRYGRGIDYMHYIDVYKYNLEENQVVFTIFNKFLKSLGVLPEYAFFFYALFFILGAMLLLKSMRMYSMYVFPCFLISVISYHEAFVRQFFAISFVLVYIYVINFARNNYNRMIAFVILVLAFIIAYSIHSVSAVTILGITVIFFGVKKAFPWQLTIPALIIGKFFLASFFDWNALTPFFNIIASSSDTKFSWYAENSFAIFSDEAADSLYTRNFIIQILETFGCMSVFYLGNKICNMINNTSFAYFSQNNADEYGHLYTTLFNTFVLGTLVLESFYNLEIARRIAYGWSIFCFVPISLILFYRKYVFLEKIDKYLMLGISYWLWEYIRFLFVFEKKPLFLWDI